MSELHLSNGTDNRHNLPLYRSDRLFDVSTSIDVSELREMCSRVVDKSLLPNCQDAPCNIPVYNLTLYSTLDDKQVSVLQDEWHAILHSGPGVFVLKHYYHADSISNIDRSNKIFDKIIAEEETSNKKKGDHFAASSANSRIWNSLQKHAIADPVSFIQYYSNPWLKHVSEAWLGPHYTVTAQLNIVRPGGKPQMPHRDYHLGFQTAEQCARWPKTVHSVSQFLTLQGAVAHSDMPLESGPTRFLPFSQLLQNGYLSWRSEEVKEYFANNWVSLPLEEGDAVFFNPALVHAAGENVTVAGINGVDRSANLLQVSSAFGKTMEKINHEEMVIACWEDLLESKLNQLERECVVRAMTDSYPFPTNLDRRPPAPGGMAPSSQTDIVLRSLEERKTKDEMRQVLKQYREESNV